MAFTTTTGANGVVSLVGTSGVDADLSIIYASNVSIEAFGANDIVEVDAFLPNGFVSGYTVKGGQGDDTVRFDTAMVASTIWGDDIDADGNVLSGNDGLSFGTVQNSTILGLGGIDTITVTGPISNSTVNGNVGNDVITVGAAPTTVPLFAGTFVDVIASNILGGVDFDTITVAAEDLIGSQINGNKGASDSINVFVSGSIIDSTIYGGQGNDIISATYVGTGTGDGFVISGDLGNDSITASVLKDTISGGEGNDSITGGAEADTMTGGAGTNTFVITNVGAGSSFASTTSVAGTVAFANGIDLVTDFKGGADSDVIDADGALATITATARRGVWNATTKVFTFNAAGPDYVVATFTGDAAADDSILLLGLGGSAPVII